jgi:predicted MFS family arabinose efflux permease
MVMGCSFACVGMVVLASATTVPLAVVSRLIVGAAQAAVMIGATTLAIDISPESRRSEAAAYVLVAFHMGLGLGPVAGELLLNLFSYRTVWLQLSALSAAGAAVAMLLPHRPGDLDAPPSPWVHAAAIAPGLVQAFGVVAFVGFMTFLPLYGRSIGVEQVGAVFATGSVTIGIVRAVLGRSLDLIGPIRADAMALASTLVGALVVASWSSAAGLYVGVVFLAGGMGLQTPSLIPVAVHGVAKAQRSSALATFTMFIDLSVALTAPIVGIIVSGVGYRAAFLATAMTTLIAFALLFGIVAPRWRAVPRPLPASGTL